MKFLVFASIFSFAVAAAVGFADNGDTDTDVKNLMDRDNNPVPLKDVLKQKEAEEIAGGYLSVLQNKPYKGQLPSKNWKNYVEKKYHEYAFSINSLISKDNDVSAITLRCQPSLPPLPYLKQVLMDSMYSLRSVPP